MFNRPKNLVFEGGGVLGIAYLGALQYLSEHELLTEVSRVAGTSAGAITACLMSMALPFDQMKAMTDSLAFEKIPGTEENTFLADLPAPLRKTLGDLFDDVECVFRLIKNFGWYSSDYFYQWIKEQIASQFDQNKKQPPYTFADFHNPEIHLDQRLFHDLYIVGTDLSYRQSKVFCVESTPLMEVAEAVRISMSIPLFFEAVPLNEHAQIRDSAARLFCDGGVMWNYPIALFDSLYFTEDVVQGINTRTLGLRFLSKRKRQDPGNILEFIKNLYNCQTSVQQDIFSRNPKDVARSIQIDPGEVSFIDFNIQPNDQTYKFLYQQGYQAAERYIEKKTRAMSVLHRQYI